MVDQVRYPWDEWFSRHRFTLKKGKDFDCLLHGMAQQVRNAAKERGIKVHLVLEETQITVTLEVPDPPRRSRKRAKNRR